MFTVMPQVRRDEPEGEPMHAVIRIRLGGFALLLAFLTLLCPGTQSNAASGPEIDASVRATLNQFFHEVWSARDLANQATAILIFPTVVKAGFGVGGEYGEGVFHIRGKTVGFYNIISGSIGVPPGAQARSVVIIFITDAAVAGILSAPR